MAIRNKQLSSSDAYPFVATWNGSNSSAATGLKVNAQLKQIVISHIGVQAAKLFESDFINYNSGYILISIATLLLFITHMIYMYFG